MVICMEALQSDKFPVSLILEDVGTKNETQVFRLVKDFVYMSEKFGRLVCKKGFETNGISTPRWCWPLIGPTSEAFKISIFHDLMYSKDCPYAFTRADADYIMLEGMVALGVGFLERQAIYRALRMWGWLAWKKR